MKYTTVQNRGSALIVVLWVIVILSLLIATFAYDMHIEAGVASHYRKRLKAEYASLAGVEFARLLLAKKKSSGGEGDEAEEVEYDMDIGERGEQVREHQGSTPPESAADSPKSLSNRGISRSNATPRDAFISKTSSPASRPRSSS